MITTTNIELRAGARVLLESASFRVAPGDRVGLVGRNGAGKTTLARALAGDSAEAAPAAGTIQRAGTVGYLPQESRAGDTQQLARDRILSVRGLDAAAAGMRTAETEMTSADGDTRDRAMRRHERLESEFFAKGGYAAEAEAATIAAGLGQMWWTFSCNRQ